MTDDATLEPLNRLVGTWETEATHPMMPGVVVHGSATIEWLEGERFLTIRALTDHPDFPDSLSVIGDLGHDRADGGTVEEDDGGEPRLRMHYFDSRGVFRVYETSVTDGAWRVWRDAPGFSQRFMGTLTDRGDTVSGLWQLRRDDVHWADDLKITYRRK